MLSFLGLQTTRRHPRHRGKGGPFSATWNRCGRPLGWHRGGGLWDVWMVPPCVGGRHGHGNLNGSHTGEAETEGKGLWSWESRAPIREARGALTHLCNS